MSSTPRKAPATVCQQITDALKDPARRFLDRNTSSRNYLDIWNLTANGFFADLADGLEQDLIFLKPKTFPNQPQRYQCVLSYPEDGANAALDIHVTLSPKGSPPRVKVAVHQSDSIQTLQRILVSPNQ